MILLIATIFSSSDKENTNKKSDLWITASDFQTAFNYYAVQRGVPQMKINIEFGTGDTADIFGYKFANGFYLLGEVNSKTGKVKKVSVVKEKMKNQTEAQAAAVAFLLIVQTLSTEIDSAERAAILDKFTTASERHKRYIAVVEGDIEYSQALIKNGTTLMLSAESKN